MALTIIHLSDLHLSDEGENSLAPREALLCGAIRSVVVTTDEYWTHPAPISGPT